MPIITIDEYTSAKIYSLDGRVYRQIERALTKAVGERAAKRLLEKFGAYTLQQFSANSYVDVLSGLIII